MTEYSPQDFYNMRKWYGKWALRYSILYLLLASLLFPVTKFGFAPLILILMLSVALISLLHLWPILRATHVFNNDKRRLKFEIWAVGGLWIGLFSLVFLIDQRNAFSAGATTFWIIIGPPIFMLEVYAMRLKKGAANDKCE